MTAHPALMLTLVRRAALARLLWPWPRCRLRSSKLRCTCARAGMATVDVYGRRPLLMGGSVGCAVTMAGATAAYLRGSVAGLLACMCTFVLAFRWAGHARAQPSNGAAVVRTLLLTWCPIGPVRRITQRVRATRSTSWAGIYWVVVSECFSMGAKSPATSAATALLFLTGEAAQCV